MPPGSANRLSRNLFLGVDSIDWLLAYAADEFHFQGVVPACPAPTAHPVGNCAAVAGLYLEWDFSANKWEAQFLEGPFAGRTKHMSIHDLDQRLWKILR